MEQSQGLRMCKRHIYSRTYIRTQYMNIYMLIHGTLVSIQNNKKHGVTLSFSFSCYVWFDVVQKGVSVVLTRTCTVCVCVCVSMKWHENPQGQTGAKRAVRDRVGALW